MKKKVKSLAKRTIKAYHIKKIEKLLNKSINYLSDNKYSEAAESDKEVIDLLGRIKDKGKEKNTKLIKKVSAYVKSLDQVTLVQQDTMADNPSVILFTSALLNSRFKIKSYKKYPFFAFVDAVIVANLRMFRWDSYKSIISKYLPYYDDYLKSNLFLKILNNNSGELSVMDHVQPLLDNVLSALEKFESKEKKYSSAYNLDKVESIKVQRLIYLKNINTISAKCDLISSDIAGVNQNMIKVLKNNYDKHIGGFINSLLLSDEYFREVSQWLKSLNKDKYDENEKIGIQTIDNRISELNTNQLQPPIERYFDKENSNYRIKKLHAMILNKNVKKIDIYNESLLTETYYKQKINKEKNIIEKSKLLTYLYQTMYVKRDFSFWSDFNKSLNKIDSVDESDTIYFFVNDNYLINGSLALPLLLEAKKRKYICVGTSPKVFDYYETKDSILNELSEAFYFNHDIRKMYPYKRHKKWDIDIEKKIIQTDGMNIFHPIFEVVSRWQFSYFLNYDTNAWARYRVNKLVDLYDAIFCYIDEIKEWAISNNKKVRFISCSPHIQNAAAYRIYCEEIGFKYDMNYICTSSGYDNYFKNVGDGRTETLTALNLTKNLDSRTSFLGTEYLFNQYFKNNIDKIDELKANAEEWFRYKRAQSNDDEYDDKKEQILKIIKKYKAENKKIILMNGKVVFDLGTKYTEGCVHSDMSHWATHTVETIKNNPNVLLLLKPHPFETKKEITMTSESLITFRDIIKTDLAENTIYLENHLFRNFDLVDYIDLGLTWNGTSTLEFAALDVKVLMGDVWGYKDYPIGFPRASTLEEYERYIINPDEIVVPDDLSEKAVAFLSYMGSRDLSIENKLTTTTTTNYGMYESSIDDAAVDKFIMHGDPNIERLFDEINK